jgi:hypothetical protein
MICELEAYLNVPRWYRTLHWTSSIYIRFFFFSCVLIPLLKICLFLLYFTPISVNTIVFPSTFYEFCGICQLKSMCELILRMYSCPSLFLLIFKDFLWCIFVHYFVVQVDGVRPCLWPVATSRPIVHPPGDTWVWTATVERYWRRKTEELGGKNLAQSHFVRHKYYMDWTGCK